jgi:putative methyltransferase (TIGR04325 family)
MLRGLKPLLPPLVFSAYNTWANKRPQFCSFESALQASVSNYENPSLVESIVSKALAYRHRLDVSHSFDIPALRICIALSFLVRDSQKNIRVLDFGGGAGSTYDLVRSIYSSELCFDWCVLETPSLANHAGALRRNGLSFLSTIQAAASTGTFDLTYCNSSLQYCDNPLAWLNQIVSLGSQYIFITRTPFLSKGSQYITVQPSTLAANGPGALPPGIKDSKISYPVTFVLLSDVFAILESDYEIVLTVEEGLWPFPSGPYPAKMVGILCRRRIN